MRSIRACGVLALATVNLVPVACGSRTRDLSARVASSTRATLLIIESEAPPRVFAVGVESDTAARYVLPVEAFAGDAWLLEYPVPVSQLGVTDGEVVLATEGGVTLPVPTSVSHADLTSSRAFDGADALPQRLAGLRLARPDLADCVSAAGCFARPTASSESVCARPCPDLPEVEAPTPPEPTELTPCAEGWRASAADAPAEFCDPWGREGPLECPVGEAHFPGVDGCTPVGDPCPNGWGSLPDGPTYFVLEGAPVGGDGSIGAPFATVSEALPTLGAHENLLIGPGRYEESLIIRSTINVFGVCAARVTIVGDPATDVIRVRDGVRVSLNSIHLEGGSNGVRVDEGATLSIYGVSVLAPDRVGAIVDGGSFGGSQFLVRGAAKGVEVVRQGFADLKVVSIVDPSEVGVLVSGDGAEVVLADTAVVGAPLVGLSVEAFGEIRAAAVVVDGPAIVGARVGNEGTLQMTDSLFRKPATSPGTGVAASPGASLEFARVAVFGTAIGMHIAGASATLTSLLLADIGLATDSGSAIGVLVTEGGQVVIESMTAANFGGTAVRASDAETLVDISDIVLERSADVASTRAVPGGLVAAGSAEMTVSRASLVSAGRVGFVVDNANLTASDVRVDGPVTWPEFTGAHGIALSQARAMVTRMGVTGASLFGVLAKRSSTLDAHDLTVRGTERYEMTGSTGASLSLEESDVTVTGFVLQDAPFSGIRNTQGPLSLENGLIEDHAIGVILTSAAETEGFDNVHFKDNGIDVSLD